MISDSYVEISRTEVVLHLHALGKRVAYRCQPSLQTQLEDVAQELKALQGMALTFDSTISARGFYLSAVESGSVSFQLN